MLEPTATLTELTAAMKGASGRRGAPIAMLPKPHSQYQKNSACKASNQNGREPKQNIGNNDLPSASTQMSMKTPKFVTYVITSAENKKCVNPLSAKINITVRNRNPQICVDPRIYSRVNFCDHHRLSAMVELFASLIV